MSFNSLFFPSKFADWPPFSLVATAFTVHEFIFDEGCLEPDDPEDCDIDLCLPITSDLIAEVYRIQQHCQRWGFVEAGVHFYPRQFVRDVLVDGMTLSGSIRVQRTPRELKYVIGNRCSMGGTLTVNWRGEISLSIEASDGRFYEATGESLDSIREAYHKGKALCS